MTDTDKIEVVAEGADHYVRLPIINTMIDHTLMGSEKNRDFQVAEMVENTVFDAVKMCAVETPDGLVQPTISLVTWLATGNILVDGVVAGSMQNVSIKVAVHHSMSKPVFDVLLKNDDPMAPIANFVSIYVANESTCVKKKEDLAGSGEKIHELPPPPPA